MPEIGTSGLMSGDGKRGIATAPVLDSTEQTLKFRKALKMITRNALSHFVLGS